MSSPIYKEGDKVRWWIVIDNVAHAVIGAVIKTFNCGLPHVQILRLKGTTKNGVVITDKKYNNNETLSLI